MNKENWQFTAVAFAAALVGFELFVVWWLFQT